MKKLIAAVILFASSAVYAEEAKTDTKPAAQGEAKAESPAPVEKPLDNKALIEMVEKIAAVKLDKKKTDVEKDAAISTLVGKKFEITCKLTESKKDTGDRYDVVFVDKSKDEVTVYTSKEAKKNKDGRKFPKHIISIRSNTSSLDLAGLPAGTEVTLCGVISKGSSTPSVSGELDYNGDVKSPRVYLFEKDLTLKQ